MTLLTLISFVIGPYLVLHEHFNKLWAYIAIPLFILTYYINKKELNEIEKQKPYEPINKPQTVILDKD